MKKILFIVSCLVAIAFADGDRAFEITPYMDFNGSLHAGTIGSELDGFAFNAGFGAEFLYVASDNFAFGVNVKTDIGYDSYIQSNKPGMLVDEYGVWTASFGGIVYMGEMFYMSYMAMYNVDTFHEASYVSTDDGDFDVEKLPYTVSPLDYFVEVGLRTSFHFSVYVDVTTHLIETDLDNSKYQIYLGFRYNI